MGDGKKEIVANDMRLTDFIELGWCVRKEIWETQKRK